MRCAPPHGLVWDIASCPCMSAGFGAPALMNCTARAVWDGSACLSSMARPGRRGHRFVGCEALRGVLVAGLHVPGLGLHPFEQREHQDRTEGAERSPDPPGNPVALD